MIPTKLVEFMPEVFTRSEVLPLYFPEIAESDLHKNIQRFIQTSRNDGDDPRSAAARQGFNNKAIDSIDSRYLVGRYGEDRSDILGWDSHMVHEGRVYHMAIDVFSQYQEPVFAPCDGTIVVSEYEPGEHNFGHYLILKPADESLPYIFFGHLAADKRRIGHVKSGEQIARLGSYEQLENGGWSIHLHLQLLVDLPSGGKAPIGYSGKQDLLANKRRFPDPQSIFPEWSIKR